MKKILAPTDGSENSKKALMKAREIAEAFDSEVVILNVVRDIILNTDMVPQYTIDTNKDLKDEGRNTLKKAKEIFDGSNIKLRTKLRTGDSATCIIDEIREGDYDLIVMGSRGRGVFSRAMLGSVSNSVLNNVKTNVLIVK